MIIDEPYKELDRESLDVFFKILSPYYTDNKGLIMFTHLKDTLVHQPSHVFEFTAGNLKAISKNSQGEIK